MGVRFLIGNRPITKYSRFHFAFVFGLCVHRIPPISEMTKASTAKVLALVLTGTSGQKCLEASRSPAHKAGPAFIRWREAAPVSLTCPKTTILSAALPHSRGRRPGGTGGQPALWRIVAVGWPSPPAALVLVARSLVEKSPRTRARLPALCSEPRRSAVERWTTYLSYTTRKTGGNGDAF